MRTEEFNYSLPESLIAQQPAKNRHDSRLMVLYYKSKKVVHSTFRDICSFLSPAHLLVVNDTKVFPARLLGRKESGGAVEILLVREVDGLRWEAMVQPSARVKEGTPVAIDGWNKQVSVEERLPGGSRLVQFPDECEPLDIAFQYGHMPLPPYIKRDVSDKEQSAFDFQRYQTIFARDAGSVAAPTASLHFTDTVLAELQERSVGIQHITLHVGPGTFKPVKTDTITDHVMDYEYYAVSQETERNINTHISNGGTVCGVGTTVVRTLEAISDESGRIHAGNGKTDLFIYPGYSFKIVRNMLTNFHLPKSTLLMLVCALAGSDFVLSAYHEAIREKYRFYSYGDAMLLLNQ
ncbi:MAG: tRNA preQ1(34) S-adenosylmethionine ribosyltransferase-isomerase QueA [Candidatus Auribacter fodinae]|jgi:S-adenosylmethionine:tRNA ribosyltransferase-isomerase|uniref:S-adenosylmethionine:tRNA ribosyltransferase-isomerase n=1 Tax=Candidatus Auribacter fodinae TaxID=2093366 RepID=A0A3A4QTK7_9BACT|nr:MAG: tRNA preQ1(34) S-adenosylmethionine ribosyltransferase-isomerase QueA [Candidatus Auribacter fodinae]